MSQNKILVEWMDGRSKGKMLWVNRSSVKGGTPTTGEKVRVIWRKSKKTYAAIVRESESVLSPTILHQMRTSIQAW